MIDRNGSKPTEYEVGYRRPPKAAQFAPGKSGNPRGRPKGLRSVAAILHGIIHQKIAVTENGKTRRIPALEVVVRRLLNDAMRSDLAAIKLLVSLVDRYGESNENKPALSDLMAEDKAILSRYLREPDPFDADNPMNADRMPNADGV